MRGKVGKPPAHGWQIRKRGWGGYPVCPFHPEPKVNSPVSELGMNTNTSTPTSRATMFLAPAFAFCGALAIFAGCASEESHVVSAPPPSPATTQVVTTQTTQTTPTPTYVTTTNPGTSYTTTTTSNPNPAVNTIIVTQAPPAPQQEVILARPSGDYVWLPGYWTWREERYQWVSGHWELPPNRGSSWVAPRWEQEGNAYRFYEGHWN